MSEKVSWRNEMHTVTSITVSRFAVNDEALSYHIKSEYFTFSGNIWVMRCT